MMLRNVAWVLVPLTVGLLAAGCSDSRRSPQAGGEGEDGAEGEGHQHLEGEGENEGNVEGEGTEGEGLGVEGEGEGEGSCTPGDKKCVGSDSYYCVSTRTWELLDECAIKHQTCEHGLCVGCTPGAKQCRGQSVTVCQDDGKTELVDQVCGVGSECRSGGCVSICGSQGGKISYQGCEYFAVDLENADIDTGAGSVSPADAQFAVVISNTDPVNSVTVDVYRIVNGHEELVQGADGQPGHREIAPRHNGSGGIEIFNLPKNNGLVGSEKGAFAYRIAASGPVIAYQFNPLNNTEAAYSNASSLLLPTNALDTDYYVTTGDAIKLGDGAFNTIDAGAYVVVVGVTDQPAHVTVEATNDIMAFHNAQGVTVRGRTVTATLNRYDVLSVESSLPAIMLSSTDGDGNLSGSHVTSDQPVAVFSGNVATVVPNGPDGSCCADHLESQLFPTSSWGRLFVGPHSLVRRVSGTPEADYWRLTAAQDGTTFTYTPRRPPNAPQQLDAGESEEFSSTAHFVVEANKPVLLTQFLSSSMQVLANPNDPNWNPPTCMAGANADQTCTQQIGSMSVCFSPMGIGQCSPVSDPEMILIPPTEQFRQDYLFLTPRDYRIDSINVIAKAGTQITLDDQALDAANFVDVGHVGDDDWKVMTMEVGDGAHYVTGNQPFGLVVYGYDKDVSYGYPAGLNLERINQGAQQ